MQWTMCDCGFYADEDPDIENSMQIAESWIVEVVIEVTHDT